MIRVRYVVAEDLKDIWNNPEKAQNLNKEKVQLTAVLEHLDAIHAQLRDLDVLLEMAAAEEDNATVNAVIADVGKDFPLLGFSSAHS